MNRHRFFFTLICSLCLVSFCRAADISTSSRPATSEADKLYWIANMLAHQYSPDEMATVLGTTPSETSQAIAVFKTASVNSPETVHTPGNGKLLLLPYPGGRHPRIGFLDGAVDPQRETKISLFAPWKNGGYVVLDLPEAIWHEPEGKRELLYLAHTHIPTIWDKQKIKLSPLEWNRKVPGELSLNRKFPSNVSIQSKATLVKNGVQLELGIHNGSEVKLTGLHVQVCAMLKGLTGFDSQTNDNKVFDPPFAACKDSTGKRWVILGFDHCVRAWGNPPCPCLHSDPQFPDASPGQSQSVTGWLSFYEGEEIQSELKRLKETVFKP